MRLMGHSRQEGGGQVEQGAGEGILAVEGRCLLFRQTQDTLELPQDNGLVQQVQKAHARLTDGNGDTQPQQPFEDDDVALCLVAAPEDRPPVAAVIHDHVDHSQHRTGADAHDSTGSADLQRLAHPDEVPGQGKADEELEQCLNELGYGCGHHVLAGPWAKPR